MRVLGSGSGGWIRTSGLMLMRHPRYSFSTPQWVVSYSLRLEVTFDTHCYAANIRFHQQVWGLLCAKETKSWLATINNFNPHAC